MKRSGAPKRQKRKSKAPPRGQPRHASKTAPEAADESLRRPGKRASNRSRDPRRRHRRIGGRPRGVFGDPRRARRAAGGRAGIRSAPGPAARERPACAARWPNANAGCPGHPGDPDRAEPRLRDPAECANGDRRRAPLPEFPTERSHAILAVVRQVCLQSVAA
jgi:hypothetical protein